MKNLKKCISIFLIMAQLLSMTILFASENTRTKDNIILINTDNIYEKTAYYKNNVLGPAGSFNLVGFNSIEGTTNVGGNILTNTLKYNADFGTKGVEEVSYFRNLNANNSITTAGHENSILVVGKNVAIGTVDNDASWAINGKKLNKPEKSNSLWQDGQQAFIDLDKLKKETIELASNLSKLDNRGITLDSQTHSPPGHKTDPNNQKMKVSEAEQFAVYNMKAEDFKINLPIPIEGFHKTQISTLIINVDMNNRGNSFFIPKSVASYKDGTQVLYEPTKNWSNVNVIWNIFDSSRPDNIYSGRIENTGLVTGMILSPGADVIIRHDIKGNIIANNIVAAGGSTFRNDYMELEIQSIVIDPSEKELITGQTFALKAVLEPSFIAKPKLEWSSSDPSIVSVDENGKILALKKGKATITVETESGLQARSNITVKSLLVPTDISRPNLAGYNFTHPQSLTRINMKLEVGNELRDGKLRMEIPGADLLFDFVKAIKLDGRDCNYRMTSKSIEIDLGDLIGINEYPGIYDLQVYVKMKPAAGLKVANYNQRVSAKEKLVITNKLTAWVDIGEEIEEETSFELEPYNLELIRIPKIN